ncbi:FecR family protein [Arachidicoccus terrestris]|uniref:FecR family protein n=1 Tax=Arachidicoccus terrestris TaxID=2875539 RepID=UPI001CC35B92|nr:FecR family protein [Arachidicoccus terrestris]UAY55750.1 DUF4974 domain-containing protein [Arachidicoccus terrestris]
MKDEDVTDLLRHESFLNYLFGRNAEDERYWADWLERHPGYQDEVNRIKRQVQEMARASEESVVKQHYAELQERIAMSRATLALPQEGKKIRPLWPRIRIAIAAAALVLVTLGAYYWIQQKRPDDLQVAQAKVQDVQPGGNKAVLTLAGGRQITLTNAATGMVAEQGDIVIRKTSAGEIAYQDGPSSNDLRNGGTVQMNTITTPRGGKWTLTLSDGTRVWLNAASSITYPVAFTANVRQVSITGEAYFEVVHNERQPFTVMAGGLRIEDIGTAFNVKAYPDEADTRTTLVEGSVRISNGYGAAILEPGYQAKSVRETNGGSIEVGKAKDLEQILAWKNDLFIFNRTDLHSLMRELSRWYDVDVVYEKGVKNDVFYGRVLRNNTLSQILKVLELGNVRFRIEGKKLIVMP